MFSNILMPLCRVYNGGPRNVGPGITGGAFSICPFERKKKKLMVLTHTNTFKKQKATKQYVTRINKKQELASKQETSQRLQKHATEK